MSHEDKNQPTHARIGHVEIKEDGILIKAIYLTDENGQYIRDAQLTGKIFCTLTESLLPITICK
jgi:hypothetical protein